MSLRPAPAPRSPSYIDAPWLSAIEHRGEGIFLEFDSAAVVAWETQAAVVDRGCKLMAGPDSFAALHRLPVAALRTLTVSLESGLLSAGITRSATV